MTILRRVCEIGELHPEEGKITLAESAAPVLDQLHQSFAVDVSLAATGFRFALVPKRTFDRILHERGHHAVVQGRRFMWIPRPHGQTRTWTLSAVFLPFLKGLLI